MRKVFTLLFLMLVSYWGKGQTLTEDFSYTPGSTLTSNGWTATSGTGTNDLVVNTTGLTYPGSPASNVGYSCSFLSTGQDAYKSFAPAISVGSVYASFLLKISSAGASGDYFAGLGTTAFSLRVYAKSTTGGYFLGVSKGSTGTITYESVSSNTLLYGTTYLIVVKYTFNTSTTTDDQVSLWVNPALGSSEGSATLTTTDGTDANAGIAGFFIRQGTAANAPSGVIDGIRADASWNVVPVTLTNFSGVRLHKNSLITWSTASEQNNSGFEIQRSTDGINFDKIGFVKSLSSSGNSSTRLDYSFTDYNPVGLKQYYRLKQIDFDGAYKYSAIVLVTREAPTSFELTRVYPNPTQESVYINAAAHKNMELQLFIYDLGGRVVGRKQVVVQIGNNGFDMPVAHLAPGTYFIKVVNSAQEVVATQKFIKQ